jgi:hypothetical protein
MMFNPIVVSEIVNFLETGAFKRDLDMPEAVKMLATSFQQSMPPSD